MSIINMVDGKSLQKHPSSTTLANFVGSVLSHSLNTVYAVRYAHPNCAFSTTSHTPKLLSATALGEKFSLLKYGRM
jgi:hypothetical protein